MFLPDFRERFEPGAFGAVRAIDLNLQHDPDLVVVRDALLIDGFPARAVGCGLNCRKDRRCSRLVRNAVRSTGSRSSSARRPNGVEGVVRVVERAELTGLALVDRGADPEAPKPRFGGAPASGMRSEHSVQSQELACASALRQRVRLRSDSTTWGYPT